MAARRASSCEGDTGGEDRDERESREAEATEVMVAALTALLGAGVAAAERDAAMLELLPLRCSLGGEARVVSRFNMAKGP